MTPALARLVKAVKAIYYSAVWHPDRPVPNENELWTELRDAAGFEPGHSPVPLAAVAQAGEEPSDAMKGYEKGLGVLRHELNAARAAIRLADEHVHDELTRCSVAFWEDHPAVQAALEEKS